MYNIQESINNNFWENALNLSCPFTENLHINPYIYLFFNLMQIITLNSFRWGDIFNCEQTKKTLNIKQVGTMQFITNCLRESVFNLRLLTESLFINPYIVFHTAYNQLSTLSEAI